MLLCPDFVVVVRVRNVACVLRGRALCCWSGVPHMASRVYHHQDTIENTFQLLGKFLLMKRSGECLRGTPLRPLLPRLICVTVLAAFTDSACSTACLPLL